MSVVINQNVPVTVTQGVTANVVLQPGSVISAQVLQILGNDQVRIAIGNQSIDVLSQIPLQAGQTLQLAVSQAADGIRLAVVNQQGGTAASPSLSGLASSTAALDSITLAPNLAVGTVAQATPALQTNQLTPLQALAVSTAAQIAVTQQTSLAPLFANLSVAAGLNGLPPQVQLAVAQLLAQRTSLDQNLTGDAVKQAFLNSGLFLEASLASGSLPSATAPDLKAALIVLRQVLATSLDGAAAPQGATLPQGTTLSQGATVLQSAALQAEVITQNATPAAVLEQVAQPLIPGSAQAVTITAASEALTTGSPSLAPQLTPEISASKMLPQGAALPIVNEVLDLGAAGRVVLAASTPADAAARAAANAAGLSLLQETLEASPHFALNSSGLALEDGLMLSLLPAVTGTRAQKVDDAAFVRTNIPPPPISGALPAAQPVMPATLAANLPSDTAMRHLLNDTEAAIARQTLLQVASLPDRIDSTAARQDPTAPRWNFEIPFATPQGTAVAQFDISRDGGGNQIEAAKRVWRARFSLDVEPAGPVHALISLIGDKTSVRMWAERPATAAQLRAGASQLSQALSRAELQPGDIVVRDGAPTQPAPAAAGHFLDRAL